MSWERRPAQSALWRLASGMIGKAWHPIRTGWSSFARKPRGHLAKRGPAPLAGTAHRVLRTQGARLLYARKGATAVAGDFIRKLLGRKPAFEIFFEPWYEPCRHENLPQCLGASSAAQADGAVVAAR